MDVLNRGMDFRKHLFQVPAFRLINFSAMHNRQALTYKSIPGNCELTA